MNILVRRMSGGELVSIQAALQEVGPLGAVPASVPMQLLGFVKALTLRAGRSEPCSACIEELARLQHKRAQERGAHFETNWDDEDEHIQDSLRAEALVALGFLGGCRCPVLFDAPKLMVLSIAFSPDFSKVIMVRKKRPEAQKGLLNGVGGKRELQDGGTWEPATDANEREFFEETGRKVEKSRWRYAGRMSDAAIREWEVQVFTTVLTHEEVAYMENLPAVNPQSSGPEQVVVPTVEYALSGQGSMGNIPWLVAYCRDLHRDATGVHGPPASFDVRY